MTSNLGSRHDHGEMAGGTSYGAMKAAVMAILAGTSGQAGS